MTTLRRSLAGLFVLASLSAPLCAQSASVSLLKVDDPDPVPAGTALVYTVTASNEGPDDAANVVMSDPLPAGTTFQSVSAPGGWNCSVPAVGAGGTVVCSNATFAVGGAVFAITVNVGAAVTNGTVLTNTASISSTTPDPHPGDESASADTTVTTTPTTVVSITKTAAPDPVTVGTDLTYTITATNAGNGTLESAAVSDPLPVETTFVSLSAPGGWSCTMPAVGAGGSVDCSTSSWPSGAAVFTLVVHVSPALAGGSSFTNVAHLDVTDSGRSTSQVGSVVVHTASPAQVSSTKTAGGSFQVGGQVQYTVVLLNSSATAQSDNPGPEFSDVLPADLVLVSASASSGSATATPATNTVTWNGAIPGGGSVTLTILATVGSVPSGTVISNQGAVSYDADGNGTNEASAATDDPALGGGADPTSFVGTAPVVVVPTLGDAGLAAIAALLLLTGLFALRKGVA